MAERSIEWMSSGDAADFLGVGLRTLYKFIDDGKLHGYRFGRVIRLKRSDVESFIDSCRIEPAALEHRRAEPSSTPDCSGHRRAATAAVARWSSASHSRQERPPEYWHG